MGFWNWLIHRKKREAELDEEVQAHLCMAAQERMERGESPEQSRASAARECFEMRLRTLYNGDHAERHDQLGA